MITTFTGSKNEENYHFGVQITCPCCCLLYVVCEYVDSLSATLLYVVCEYVDSLSATLLYEIGRAHV